MSVGCVFVLGVFIFSFDWLLVSSAFLPPQTQSKPLASRCSAGSEDEFAQVFPAVFRDTMAYTLQMLEEDMGLNRALKWMLGLPVFENTPFGFLVLEEGTQRTPPPFLEAPPKKRHPFESQI